MHARTLIAFVALASSGCLMSHDLACEGGGVRGSDNLCVCPEGTVQQERRCIEEEDAGGDDADVELDADDGDASSCDDGCGPTDGDAGDDAQPSEDAGPHDTGSDSADSERPPAPDPVQRNIGVGEGFACALRVSGQPVCWGPGLGRAGGAPVVILSTLSVGTTHACGVRPDGNIQCWGGNQSGQASPPSTGGFMQVAAGHDHTCALKTDGRAVCWGANDSGQASPPASMFSTIVAGHAFTCGLSSGGLVSCWGWGDGRTDAPPTVSFDSIALGGIGGCGIRTADQHIQCWQGGTPTASLKPPDRAFSRVAYGATYLCGIRLDGGVECWGDERVSSPADAFKEVAPSSTQLFACGITTTDRVSCWGEDATVLPLAPE